LDGLGLDACKQAARIDRDWGSIEGLPHTQPFLNQPQVTSHISIHYWRQRYSELLPFMRESGVTPEEADDVECIRLLAEWNGACAYTSID